MLVLFLFLFISFLNSYTATETESTTNYLRIYKTNGNNPLAFNIKIGGVNYFPNDQIVAAIGNVQIFPFKREYDDPVAVVFSEYSPYPGLFVIDSFENNTFFDSTSSDFFIINQCSSGSDPCDLKIEPFGNWSSFRMGKNNVTPSATISINKAENPIKFINSSYQAKIKKDDVIKISTVTSVNPHGLTLITTFNGASQGAPIKWFNHNLATQVIIPSIYFLAPLNNVTIFEGSRVTIRLVSYPLDQISDVFLHCGGRLVRVNQVKTNLKNPTTFTVTTRNFGNNCRFSNGGLNSVYFTVQAQTPNSISFVAPKTGSTFAAGTNIPIRINSSPESGNFSVELKCNKLSVSRVIRSNLNNEMFLIPVDFMGNNCPFDISYPRKATNPPSINIRKPNLAIIVPQPNTRITAGSNTTILINSETNISNDVLVHQLDCGGGLTKSLPIRPNILQYFLVPEEVYSETWCVFRVIDYPRYYNVPGVVTVIVIPPPAILTTTTTATATTSQPTSQTVTSTATATATVSVTTTATSNVTTSLATMATTTSTTMEYTASSTTATATATSTVTTATSTATSIDTPTSTATSIDTPTTTATSIDTPTAIVTSIDTPTSTATVTPVLRIEAPVRIIFGQIISLRVDYSGPERIKYNVKFDCDCGDHKWIGLITGRTYDLVPADISGKVEIIVTATNGISSKASLEIIKLAENQPPIYIPASFPEIRSSDQAEAELEDVEEEEEELGA